ncbi:high-potential iron-sulfur protein [Lacimicrobium alkaliphilum]|uniref:High-potential iron-sulfur protein n=1 Tax=Lacimicrobium alkaliphilum TaxID=1526571 RepID=A0A0U2RMI8_9ALTE|nr:high-potential iron-sulfur protein [Lacimicrobium alkaliphilum]ALS98490.1 high-potential iron sulfur protein 2 [Lacimicrobium alkaliphilum]
MSNINRRSFLKISGATLIGLTTGGITLRASAQEKLSLDNPSAKALQYVHKSEKDGQDCSNCMHIQGDANKDWRPCALFPNKLVANKGWCAAWAKAN